MSAAVIESIANLRAGDIMLTSMSGAPARALVYGGQLMLGEYVRLGKFVVGHAGVITYNAQPNGYHDAIMVQAMPHGAESVEISAATHWNTHTLFARLPEDWSGQAQHAADTAREMIGIPYSFASYAALAADRWHIRSPRLHEWIDRRDERGLPREAICSVLADQAWTAAGKRVCRGVAQQAVTPGRLTLSLLATPGVIWGGKGWGRVS